MKFVTLIDASGGHYQFVFPEVLVHADMADLMRGMLIRDVKTYTEVKSAGFFEPGTDFTMHGESESIGLKVHPADVARFALGEAIRFLPDDEAIRMWNKARVARAR